MTRPSHAETSTRTNDVPQTIRRVHPGSSRCAPGRARRRQRVGRTTRGDRRQRGLPLEPGRGDHARRVPGAERRCAACLPDQHGHGAGRRVRRGQRDRQEAASAISAQEAYGCEGIDRCRRRDGGVRRALGARLDGTRPSSVPGSGGTPDTLSSEYAASLDAIDNGASKKQGIKIGHAAAKAMLDARVDDGRFGPSQWEPNTGVGHWQPLLNAARGADPRSDPVGGRREAVPHPELVAVPQRATARA